MIQNMKRAGTRPSSAEGRLRAKLWHRSCWGCGLLSIVFLVGSIEAERAHAQSAPVSRAAKIANALTAAPEEIARNATVKDWPATEGAGFVLLREGTNGWVCLPDDAATRGNDPMCMDETFHAALSAFIVGQAPKVTRVGFAYMLTSDAEGSNMSPMDRSPTATNHWHHAGPHIMLLYPDAKLLEGLPTTPTAYGPYVMFPGTPVAHVMLPVASGYARAGSHRPSDEKSGKKP